MKRQLELAHAVVVTPSATDGCAGASFRRDAGRWSDELLVSDWCGGAPVD